MLRTTAAVVAAMVSLLPVCASANPSNQELQAHLEQLKARIQELENPQDSTPDAREVDATVSQVLADAEQRSQFLAESGFTAGYGDGKFQIRSADGSFSFSPSVFMQVRYVFNFRQDAQTDGDGDIEKGFEIRRAKMTFSGNAFNPQLTYLLRWDTNQSTGSPFLQDAWVQYRFSPNWTARVGQFRDIVYHEEVVFDAFLLMTERSLVNQLIGGGQTDRVQGAEITYENDSALVKGVFHDGYNSKNVSFVQHQGGTALMPGGNNFGFSVRGEYFVAGKKSKAYDRLSAYGNTKDPQDLLVFGGGLDWTQGGANNIVFQGVDVQYEPASVKGLAFYAGLLGLYRQIATNDVSATPPEGFYYDWGFVVQASYLLTEKWEVFARYDHTFLDDGALAAGANDSIGEASVGANYYWHGYNARFTVDLNYMPNGVPSDQPALDYLANQDAEFVIRAQIALNL